MSTVIRMFIDSELRAIYWEEGRVKCPLIQRLEIIGRDGRFFVEPQRKLYPWRCIQVSAGSVVKVVTSNGWDNKDK